MLSLLVLVLAVPWHEIMGHGLAALLAGGSVTRIQVFGLQLSPTLAWTGIDEGLGFCGIGGVMSQTAAGLVQLAGSTSTLIAAIFAGSLLKISCATGVRRVLLGTMCVWSLDMLTFMLPSIGLRRYVVTGTRWSEPYDAAHLLGCDGPLFQVVVFATCLAPFALLFWPRRSDPSPRGTPTDVLP